MPLLQVSAVAHPDGNRVDLSWQYAISTPAFDGVRVVRRQGRYPEQPDDGVIVADVTAANVASDVGLPAEQVYYYGLFPFVGDPPVYEINTANRATSLVTAPNGYGAYMLKLLPAIYHRYDKDTQFLARFLQLTGGQLDQFHSLANFSAHLRHLQKTPGELLPLLAQWIGWKTDYKRDLISQRKEINYAPGLYSRMGLLPTVEATIKRISGWESHTKEYVHNVFASNRPARLNLWTLQCANNGVWTTQEQLLTTDYCYEGRATHAVDENDVHWLFYHTQRQGRWEIWYKTSPSYLLTANLATEVTTGVISNELWFALTEAGIALDQTSQLTNISSHVWEINDGPQRFVVELSSAAVWVYDVNHGAQSFAPSQALIVNECVNKYPSSAAQGSNLWVFWTSYDESSMQWQVHYRRRYDAQWDEVGPRVFDDATSNPFMKVGVYDTTVQRRRAYVSADGNGGLWLCWQERVANRWQLLYNYHNGTAWSEAIELPLDASLDPQVQDDIMLLVTPSLPNPRLYLFWSRQRPVSSATGSCWQVALRVKTDQLFNNANWSPVHVLPKALIDNHHDREPFAILSSLQQVELFWASNRTDSGWSIWRTTLIDYATDAWSTPERISEAVYQQRAPLAINNPNGLTLLYRSNRHIVYHSDVYRSTENFDERYAGSLFSDVRHQQLIKLRDRFEDPQRYTHDMGDNGKRDDTHRISRDTLGVFLSSETLDDTELHKGIDRLRQVVREFMPITDRAVFIPNRTVHVDYIYGYDSPPQEDSQYIVSAYSDVWLKTDSANAMATGEDFMSSLDT
ncbi:MAG: hypothetical protein WC762_06710 [Methylobacter sp.]|jgi:phage tail-like protein